MMKLEMKDRTEFIEHYLNILSKCKSDTQMADIVWKFANSQWTKGYNQGKYDPDFIEEL